MASWFLHIPKKLTGLASIESASEGKITSYLRYVYALNLQKISDMLASGWTFYLAMDMSTQISTSYSDIHIRPFACGAIQNFHLHDILMFSSHTGEEIFLQSESALDFICPNRLDLIVPSRQKVNEDDRRRLRRSHSL